MWRTDETVGVNWQKGKRNESILFFENESIINIWII